MPPTFELSYCIRWKLNNLPTPAYRWATGHVVLILSRYDPLGKPCVNSKSAPVRDRESAPRNGLELLTKDVPMKVKCRRE
jgi:hypothetical protein